PLVTSPASAAGATSTGNAQAANTARRGRRLAIRSVSPAHGGGQLEGHSRFVDGRNRLLVFVHIPVERVGVFDVEDVVDAEVELEIVVDPIAGKSIDQRIVLGDRIAFRLAVVLHLAADEELVLQELEGKL